MTKQTEQTEVVTIRLGSTEKSELESIAQAESRTFAGQCRQALREWLETKSAIHGASAKPRIGRA